MPKRSSLLTHLWIKLAALALAAAGFWLVPEDPSLPALLLTAVALPLALLGGLVLWIAERRTAARARGSVLAARTSLDDPEAMEDRLGGHSASLES